MWKRIWIVVALSVLALAGLAALAGGLLPARAGAAPGLANTVPPAARANPFSDAWLAANHGKFDNVWTAEYESRLQQAAQRSLPALFPRLLPDADVRMSNASFNTSQNEFQIDINPTHPLYAIGTSNDSLVAGVGIYRTSDGGASWTAFDAPSRRMIARTLWSTTAAAAPAAAPST